MVFKAVSRQVSFLPRLPCVLIWRGIIQGAACLKIWSFIPMAEQANAAVCVISPLLRAKHGSCPLFFLLRKPMFLRGLKKSFPFLPKRASSLTEREILMSSQRLSVMKPLKKWALCKAPTLFIWSVKTSLPISFAVMRTTTGNWKRLISVPKLLRRRGSGLGFTMCGLHRKKQVTETG